MASAVMFVLGRAFLVSLIGALPLGFCIASPAAPAKRDVSYGEYFGRCVRLVDGFCVERRVPLDAVQLRSLIDRSSQGLDFAPSARGIRAVKVSERGRKFRVIEVVQASITHHGGKKYDGLSFVNQFRIDEGGQWRWASSYTELTCLG